MTTAPRNGIDGEWVAVKNLVSAVQETLDGWPRVDYA